MAALGDVVLDGYLYPACALYSYRCLYPAAAAKGKSGADAGGKIKKKKKTRKWGKTETEKASMNELKKPLKFWLHTLLHVNRAWGLYPFNQTAG